MKNDSHVLSNVQFLLLGTLVGLSLYTMHRDPLIWDNPEVRSYVRRCRIIIILYTVYKSVHTDTPM